MSELIDAMGEALTNRSPDSGLGIGGLIERLAAAAGSGSAAARLIGVAPVTFNRWLRGVQRPKVGEGIIRKALRAQLTPPALLADIKAKRRTLNIVGRIKISGDERVRTCDVGNYIPKGVMTRIINLWLAGSDDSANRRLWNAIDKYYVEGMDITQIDRCEFK